MSKKPAPLRRSASPRRRPPTSNYYRSGAAPASDVASPFQKKSSKVSPISKFLARFVDVVFVAALLMGLVYSLIVSSNPKVQVDDTFYHTLGNYRGSTHRLLSAVKDRNKITFDEKSLISGLMLDYPEVEGVSVELPVFSQQPVVRIKVAAPSFVLNSSSRSYVIDANGKAIGTINNFPKSSSLPTITDQSNYPAALGKSVLSSTDVAFIKSLIAESNKSGVKLESLILPNTPAELDAKPAGHT